MMKLLLGGRATDRDLVEKIALEQAALDGRYVRVYGSWVADPKGGGLIKVLADDDAHFVVESSRISLQVSMRILPRGVISTTFPSPKVMTRETCAAFVEFANALNVARVRTGLFAVDVEDLDIYYQAFLPSSLLRADLEEARKLLLETGVRCFETMSVPIWGLAKNGWPAAKGILYMNQILD